MWHIRTSAVCHILIDVLFFQFYQLTLYGKIQFQHTKKQEIYVQTSAAHSTYAAAQNKGRYCKNNNKSYNVLHTVITHLYFQWVIYSYKKYELNELIGNAGIVRFIKSRRMAWLGHVMPMDGGRMPRRILEWKPVGRRIRSRLRKRWTEDVEEDIQTMGIRGWRKLSKERME